MCTGPRTRHGRLQHGRDTVQCGCGGTGYSRGEPRGGGVGWGGVESGAAVQPEQPAAAAAAARVHSMPPFTPPASRWSRDAGACPAPARAAGQGVSAQVRGPLARPLAAAWQPAPEHHCGPACPSLPPAAAAAAAAPLPTSFFLVCTLCWMPATARCDSSARRVTLASELLLWSDTCGRAGGRAGFEMGCK